MLLQIDSEQVVLTHPREHRVHPEVCSVLRREDLNNDWFGIGVGGVKGVPMMITEVLMHRTFFTAAVIANGAYEALFLLEAINRWTRILGSGCIARLFDHARLVEDRLDALLLDPLEQDLMLGLRMEEC